MCILSRREHGAWWRGAVAQWRSGAVAQWRSGAVAQWRSGAVAQWRSGAVVIVFQRGTEDPGSTPARV
jgi:hypothetical protein